MDEVNLSMNEIDHEESDPIWLPQHQLAFGEVMVWKLTSAGNVITYALSNVQMMLPKSPRRMYERKTRRGNE